MKKTLSALSGLCISLLLLLFLSGQTPVQAKADEAVMDATETWYYVVLPNGTAACDGTVAKPSGAVCIPESIDGYPVTVIYPEAFADRNDSIEKVIIPEGVTYIGHNAFDGCVNLESVTLPKSLTEIGQVAFYGCTKLHDLVLPDGLKKIGDEAFENCDFFGPNLVIPDGVTQIGSLAFWNDSRLYSVTIPQSVTLIYSDSFGPSQCIIRGFAGSAAQTWTNRNFDDPDHPEISYFQQLCIVKFDANGEGGSVSFAQKTVVDNHYYDEEGAMQGELYGKLASACRTGYLFLGWFTDPSGGERITEEDVVQLRDDLTSVTLYAHWKQSSSIESFIHRLYNVCLDREAEREGLTDWTTRLKNKSLAGSGAVHGIIFSPEFKNKNFCNEDYVKYLYRAFLGREAEPGGLADWIGRLEKGWSRERVFNGFVGSDEFTKLCSAYGITRGDGIDEPQYGTVPTGPCSNDGTVDGVTAFVRRLYNISLGRVEDPMGLKDWTGQLWAHTNSGAGVAYGFIFSPEFLNRNLSDKQYVATLYRSFFNREPDTAGYADWLGRLKSGSSRLNVFYGFVGSDEFTALCGRYGIVRG